VPKIAMKRMLAFTLIAVLFSKSLSAASDNINAIVQQLLDLQSGVTALLNNQHATFYVYQIQTIEHGDLPVVSRKFRTFV
jgi:hypothetical protein